MLKQQAKLFNRIVMALDGVAFSAAFFLSFYLSGMNLSLGDAKSYLWLLIAVILLSHVLMERSGLYGSLRVSSLWQITLSLAKAHIIAGVIAAALIFLVDPHRISRELFVLFIKLSFVFLALEKAALKFFLSAIRRRGLNFRYILIVGTDTRALHMIRLMEHHIQWGLKIVGLVSVSEAYHTSRVAGYEVLGSLDALPDICKQKTVDEVLFCVPMELLPHLDNVFLDMEEMGITMRMALDFSPLRRSNQEIALFHGIIPLLTFHSRSHDEWHLFLKRCLDIVGSVVGLAVTGILFPFLFIAIKLDSPGPVLFRQKRVGKQGRIFTCWKFRSMYIDAEEKKRLLMPLNEMKGAIFKITNDPRVTRVGRFIRQTSLDELPQFWNVLKGEMSLVGTRPPTPDEVAKYENWHRKRICIKPGITGLWQVSGRNRLQNFDAIARLDIEYVENWSLWLDMKILFRTIIVVFARSGSC